MGPVKAPAPFLVGAVAALAACGGSHRSALPTCASAGAPVRRPAALVSFPLPSGGVLDSTRKDASGDTVYQGVLPGAIDSTRDYYKRELPKHGYRLGEGDSEEDEAEADFTGHGASGHFKLNTIPGCDGALRLEVALR
jgi:hypothetical protein